MPNSPRHPNIPLDFPFAPWDIFLWLPLLKLQKVANDINLWVGTEILYWGVE